MNLAKPKCDANYIAYDPNPWTGGANGNFYIPFAKAVTGWSVKVTFATAVNGLSVWNGVGGGCTSTVCSFTDAGYNKQQSAGTKLTLGFQVRLFCCFALKSNA